ncbi:hypothetical protein [Gillisia limnaea]|uniref:Lipoprotein n=1 Tax=Gillisia limnaea (strain DSM 15749 / LMG 21470 / R-8282) TaxID=865937 RepID=H2BZ68_GILLR|nr:hypothetical protein [Gillisia limnaea]EHQ01197.1 hypothetical protein Gilli_0485 [Gillisia limnaea DSM 15749]
MMKYLYIFLLLLFTVSLQSCKENNESDNARERIGNGIEINPKELKFNKQTGSIANYTQSVEISLVVTNNTPEPFIFNFANITGRSKASFNPGLKRPGSIVELGLVERPNMKKILEPTDSTTLGLRIRTDLQANNLEEMLEEFSSKFSGKYELYLINLGVNKTFRTELDFARIQKSFYLDSEKVAPQDSLQMQKTAFKVQ